MKKRLELVSFNMEELGLTHIKNRDVILRSMTNNQDIESLITLSKVCEPVKIYDRNKDGIEYKTYSPFNLFADACVVDAADAATFNKEVNNLVKNNKKNDIETLLIYLKKWSKNHQNFMALVKNPKLNTLEPLSENLSQASSILLLTLKEKTISEENLKTLEASIALLKNPFADVELVITESFSQLTNYCKTNYFKI
jgi:hexosaminidase